MTQRESPPKMPGLEEEEERTAVGQMPDDLLAVVPPATPAPPPLKVDTPTAFTPQEVRRSSQSLPALRPPLQTSPINKPDLAAKGSTLRPTGGAVPGPASTNRGAATSGPPPSHGSSGPQPIGSMPLVPGPSQAPMAGPQSGMMYAHPSGPPPRGDQSFAGSTGGSMSGSMSASMVASPSVGGGGTLSGLAPLPGAPPQSLGLRADQPREMRSAPFHIVRSRAYSFNLDPRGAPIELGSGRFAKVFAGEERWLESKTDFRRPIVIKMLQKGVSEEDHMRFQMEKELLERVQGHPNIVELFASGENEDPSFLPPSIRDKCETEFMVLERLEMSLEERLKGSRNRSSKEDLLAYDMRERIFRVLDYMIPIASAVEYAHLVRNICHRDIKPANVLVGLPDTNLRGSTLQVRLADFNVAKLNDEEVQFGMTRMQAAVPGTLFFQSPEQETNILELLVNVQQGVPEVEFFEDFYIQIAKNDSFSLFNRSEQYPILYADRARKRLVLGRPYRETSETNVRARIQKSVGRPADIYSLGATLYYLLSGAYANPKTLYDAFHKFIEYERADENNTIEAYLRHEYSVINSLRAPKAADGSHEVAPADRFFSYKHYLDGNGELIDPNVMLIVAKCMIRNKPDSYCQAHDLETKGISDLVADLINLYSLYGFAPGARPTHLAPRPHVRRGLLKSRVGSRLRMIWLQLLSKFRKRG